MEIVRAPVQLAALLTPPTSDEVVGRARDLTILKEFQLEPRQISKSQENSNSQSRESAKYQKKVVDEWLEKPSERVVLRTPKNLDGRTKQALNAYLSQQNQLLLEEKYRISSMLGVDYYA